MSDKPKFITFTGRPLSGKSKIIQMLLAVRKDFEIFNGRSYTTRPAREGDVVGEYAHISHEEFDRLKARGEFLWTAPHGGYLVGTRREDVELALANPKVSVMTLVPQAVADLRGFVGDERVLSFFVWCSEADTFRRLPDRKDVVQGTLDRLRSTVKWKEELIRLGVMPIFIKNPNEEDAGSSALGEIICHLERCGL